MFKSLLVFALIATAAPAFAQNAFGHIQTFAVSETLALPGSLHDTMKAMKDALKQIDAADSSKNAANAKFADQFVSLTLHAKSFTPDHVDAKGKAEYDQLLDQTASTGRALAAAFRAGDNAKAQSLMNDLNADKKEGHGKFK